jgi:hypothetical protein
MASAIGPPWPSSAPCAFVSHTPSPAPPAPATTPRRVTRSNSLKPPNQAQHLHPHTHSYGRASSTCMQHSQRRPTPTRVCPERNNARLFPAGTSHTAAPPPAGTPSASAPPPCTPATTHPRTEPVSAPPLTATQHKVDVRLRLNPKAPSRPNPPQAAPPPHPHAPTHTHAVSAPRTTNGGPQRWHSRCCSADSSLNATTDTASLRFSSPANALRSATMECYNSKAT